ncbi:MAG: GNAT family N-acetyltransferase/peptidase C39 family protein [Rhodospirillales bacterium]|nr:GNAT family N-acetyltransferase/peptidase C39 family protein [Rhodospirillales bacterium]MCW8862798.1 GNAT family N-acetyltransferase/peptidase C39 family protein [Rhodospirillales bacterium]MCW8952653.1 GNAT family N-acetyltransferase/peptidase C39 family protein [Rhodospirillales bacterium]MCW8970777.1 GNAT family N-acetyltransferase/peptidase C39 family protein [Rhodospirillales bacterium]MCW9003244.1 GNAT family N-acetyltransferase/peptidase C39 family protein [Rhodospirillales bacterium
MIQPADVSDLDALIELENRCFEIDRLSRRAFRHLLTSPTASTATAWLDGKLVGYALVIFRRNTSLARLYSIAVLKEHRKAGIGARLLNWAEDEATDQGASVLRLEVSPTNKGAITLYRDRGYTQFAVYPDYYEDHSDAYRMEKSLIPDICVISSPVRHYSQTMDFTCGPASLLMAMHAIDAGVKMDQRAEIAIWREATTIFMTSGHGGCGPRGLALAAAKRGFDVEIFVSDLEPPFIDSVRSQEKKEVLRLVHEDFDAQVTEAGIPVRVGPLSMDELEARFQDGKMSLVLTSQYRLHGDKSPHWVTVSGFDDHYVYVSDPDDSPEREFYTGADYLSVPIPRREFEIMAKYGKGKLQAAVVIGCKPSRKKKK